MPLETTEPDAANARVSTTVPLRNVAARPEQPEQSVRGRKWTKTACRRRSLVGLVYNEGLRGWSGLDVGSLSKQGNRISAKGACNDDETGNHEFAVNPILRKRTRGGRAPFQQLPTRVGSTPIGRGGRGIADLLRMHFGRDLYRGVGEERGVSVLERSQPVLGALTPLPISWDDAEFPAVVVLAESTLIDDREWADYVLHRAHRTQEGDSGRVLPGDNGSPRG